MLVNFGNQKSVSHTITAKLSQHMCIQRWISGDFLKEFLPVLLRQLWLSQVFSFLSFCFINYKLPFIINLVCDSSLLNCIYDDTYSSSIFWSIILQKLDYKIVLQFKKQSPKPLYLMCICVCNTLKICFYSDTSYSL